MLTTEVLKNGITLYNHWPFDDGSVMAAMDCVPQVRLLGSAFSLAPRARARASHAPPVALNHVMHGDALSHMATHPYALACLLLFCGLMPPSSLRAAARDHEPRAPPRLLYAVALLKGARAVYGVAVDRKSEGEQPDMNLYSKVSVRVRMHK